MDDRAFVVKDFQKKIGLKTRQRKQRFSNFTVKPGHEAAYKAVRDFAATCAFGETKTGLMLAGPVGCGKTHLAAAIVNSVLDGWRMSPRRIENAHAHSISYINYGDNPPQIAFTSVISMLQEIRAAYDGGESAQDVVEGYARTGVLILDDLGTEKMTDWASEQLFQVIDHRYCEELSTVITTNLTPTQLKQAVGDRIFDRIREMCPLVAITEKSQRPTAKALS